MGIYVKQIVNFLRQRCAKAAEKEAENIYQRASVFVDEIPKEKIDSAITVLFKPKGQPNRYLQELSELKQLAEGSDCPKEIKEMILSLERDAKTFVEKTEEFSTKSKGILHEENYQFGQQNEQKIADINKYFFDRYIEEGNKYIENLGKVDTPDKTLYDLYNQLNDLSSRFMFGRQPVDFRITELPKGVLPENGIVYHGTTHARKIAKTGFDVNRSNQLNVASREFGSAVYLTPEKSVASNFAGITGRIMPVRANIEHTAFVENETFRTLVQEASRIANEMGINLRDRTPFSIAVQEKIVNRLFRDAGYDSVYTSNGMASGLFAKSIDEFLGKAQSQLVVFDPAKLETGLKKTFSEKIKDELLQIKSFILSQINAFNIARKDPLSTAFMG